MAALVHGVASGDHQAWNTLVERYTPLVWSVVRTHRLTTDEAAEVTQIVWLRLIEQVGKLREPTQLPAWLVQIARREALRAVQQRALSVDVDTIEEIADADPRPDEVVETDDRNARLLRAVRQLPPRCRTVISLLMTDPSPSYAEMSAALSMPVGSIGPTRARCLDHLRRLLAEDGSATDTELLGTLRRSAIGADEAPARVIDDAHGALAAHSDHRNDPPTP
jgi:RNA polymerase sigma factor (sigma-70 family)